MTSHTLTQYQHILRTLSDRLVQAQRPIHILNGIKWSHDIKLRFFEKGCRELPLVDVKTYEKNPLLFDPSQKTEEFYTIERDIHRQLGPFSGVANIMLRMCREYREVIRLLLARGTPEFSKISQELYGSSQDVFYPGAPTLCDLAASVSETLSKITDTSDLSDEKRYTSEEAVHILSKRLAKYFGDKEVMPRVKLSDDIISDASAGSDFIKLRKDALFTSRELKVLEMHEGRVHVATTLNGLAQPICTFLSVGPPSSIVSQEGLAIIMEIFTFSSYPKRVLDLTHRVMAINMAEEGANFLEVFRFYQSQGFSDEESYYAAARVFRGSTPDQGPFTKDLSYSKGFIMIFNYIHLAIRNGLQDQVRLLFLGKTTLEDLLVLADLMEEGIVLPPKYVPSQFKNIAALTAWMTYSLFLNRLSLEKLTQQYKMILHS